MKEGRKRLLSKFFQKPIIRVGNLPQICDEGKLRGASPQTQSPEPPAATGGGGDTGASLAKRSVLRWVCCRVGQKKFCRLGA